MKFNFLDSEYGTSIDLIPETVEEMAELVRVVNNIRSEKPSLILRCGVHMKPELSIWMKKVQSSKQKNSIGK